MEGDSVKFKMGRQIEISITNCMMACIYMYLYKGRRTKRTKNNGEFRIFSPPTYEKFTGRLFKINIFAGCYYPSNN